MFKIIQWLSVNIASIFAITQAILKCIKEILTSLINLFSILMPTATFLKTVKKVRDFVNTIDSWTERLKGFFLKIIA